MRGDPLTMFGWQSETDAQVGSITCPDYMASTVGEGTVSILHQVVICNITVNIDCIYVTADIHRLITSENDSLE